MNVETARSEREVWLELVAAVDYLSVTHRLGMSICHAIEEALCWWTAARRAGGGIGSSTVTAVPWDDPDPLRSCFEDLLSVVEPAVAGGGVTGVGHALVSALDAWLTMVAHEYNAGACFAVPRWATVDLA